MTLEINEEAVAAVWQAAAELKKEEDRQKSADLRQKLAESLASLGIADGEAIYIAQLTKNGYRNQVWQGEGNTKQHDFMALVRSDANLDGVIAEAKARLAPPFPNGFDAVVICEGTDDRSKIQAVVEYEHSRVAERLRADGITNFISEKLPEPEPPKAIDRSIASSELLSDYATVDDLLLHLTEALNVILEGPPGTGKTKLAFNLLERLAGGDPVPCRLESILGGRELENVAPEDLTTPPVIWEMIQLHPSYTYEDFVRGLRVQPNKKGFMLTPVDGIMPLISRVAASRPGKPTILIIDEINRGNLSSILGETIFAIDPAHRGEAISLQHERPGESGLIVPANLYLLATMNTADRSLASVDFAIRRRFRFINLPPSDAAITKFYDGLPQRGVAAASLFNAINGMIDDVDLKIGHAYFMTPTASLPMPEWQRAMRRKMIQEIRPLLLDYRLEGKLTGTAKVILNGLEVDLMEDDIDSLSSKLDLFLSGGVEN
ncbi:MAG: hypothetical protein DI589_21440 [Shinella sp.]|nr:MAG: hypothetical protein DI589_21440 [Shinella sp.]